MSWLPYADFGVQAATFAVVTLYVYYTFRLFGESRNQTEASKAPALSISTAPRDPNDAILETGGAVGTRIVASAGGMVQLENVGIGPAINIRYEFVPLAPDVKHQGPSNYLPGLSPGKGLPIPITTTHLSGRDWKCVITYESLSAKRYQTTVDIRNLVVVDVKFSH